MKASTERAYLLGIVVLLILMAALTASASPAYTIQPSDYLWICRYNVGTSTKYLDSNKLRKCMNYSLKIQTEYAKLNKRMGLQQADK